MKILVMTQNKIIAEGISIELAECGHDSQWRNAYRSGYDLYLVDLDRPCEGWERAERVITFSREEGISDVKRPFTSDELLRAIENKMGMTDMSRKSEESESEFDVSGLSETEKRLLAVLLENRGRTVSAQELSQRVWGRDSIKSNIVNVYIRYLREKLEKDSSRRVIFTVRGKGYRID